MPNHWDDEPFWCEDGKDPDPRYGAVLIGVVAAVLFGIPLLILLFS